MGCEKLSEIFRSVARTNFLRAGHIGSRAYFPEADMAKQTTITIETDSLLLLRGRSSMRAWCPRCAAAVEMVALENARVVSNLEPPALEKWLNSGGPPSVAVRRWRDPDLPAFAARSRAENLHLARRIRGYKTYEGDEMNRNYRLISLSLGMVASLAAVTALGQAGKPQYTLTDLGVLGTGDNSTATDMNSVGWVAASSNLVPGGPQHAALWYGSGPLVDLGTLGGLNSGADGPNLYGEAAVGSELATPDPDGEDFCGFGNKVECRGAIWRYGKLTVLPHLRGGRNTNAFEVNNLGQVVGWSENGIRDAACATGTPFQVFRYEAVKWEPNGHIHVLHPLKGDTVAFAMGLNDLGQAVGSSGTCDTEGPAAGQCNRLACRALGTGWYAKVPGNPWRRRSHCVEQCVQYQRPWGCGRNV